MSEKRVALVTGGEHGIGRAGVELLDRNGDHVVFRVQRLTKEGLHRPSQEI